LRAVNKEEGDAGREAESNGGPDPTRIIPQLRKEAYFVGGRSGVCQNVISLLSRRDRIINECRPISILTLFIDRIIRQSNEPPPYDGANDRNASRPGLHQ
jgi:hypothetical protein